MPLPEPGAPEYEDVITRASDAGMGIIIRGGVARGAPEDWAGRRYYMVSNETMRDYWEQAKLDDRYQRVCFERVGVLVEDLWTEEHHQVAGDVNNQIKKKCESGNADEDLRADRRTEGTEF